MYLFISHNCIKSFYNMAFGLLNPGNPLKEKDVGMLIGIFNLCFYALIP